MINQDFVSVKEKITWPKSRKEKILDNTYSALLVLVLIFSIYVIFHF